MAKTIKCKRQRHDSTPHIFLTSSIPNCLPRASYIICETYWKIKMWAPWLKKWLWISRHPIVRMKSTARKLWIWDQSQAHEAGPAPASMLNVMRVLQETSKQNASNFFVIISLATFSILYFMATVKIIWTNLLEEHGRTKNYTKRQRRKTTPEIGKCHGLKTQNHRSTE